MNVIKESLKGVWSFNGIGIVTVDGVEYGVLGSRQINCGDGKRVQYCGEQIKKVSAETENEGQIYVTISSDTTAAGDAILKNRAGKPVLHAYFIDGHPMGGEVGVNNAGEINLHPAFVMIGVQGSTGFTIETGQANPATVLPIENGQGPYYGLALRKR